MFSAVNFVILAFAVALDLAIKSQCEHLPFVPPPAPLLLYSPKDPEYLEVLVMKVGDNMTLICKLQADGKPRRFVWNKIADGEAKQELLEGSPAAGPSLNSTLLVKDLQPHHSGLYVCTAPPHSLTKYVLVQEKMTSCPRGALQCGSYCVLATALCDGHADCPQGEDEASSLCHSVTPCSDPSMVSCGRGCIPSRACCAARGSPRACVQHTCCDSHFGVVDVEYPALFEDRHVADDYGYIQSTIYTVTACALIFMIACVLLVSAICKMHMKRAALRSQHTRYIQAHRFPPCYSTRLLEQASRPSSSVSPAHSPTARLVAEVVDTECVVPNSLRPSRLARIGAMFTGAYSQVPTHPTDVELQNVQHGSLDNSPIRTLQRSNIAQLEAPNYCDDSTDFYFTNQEAESCSRDLNYMGTFDFFRRRTLNPPFTLQLGRFQLNIPNFRRPREERRPDTPDIAELSIDDMNFVRVNSNDTYTLNGRSITLLGANFENYPNISNRPPSYNEAVRLKYGPPPEYLSTDVLTTPNEITANIEMPPTYDEVRTSDSETSTPQRVVRNSVSLMASFNDGGNYSGRDSVVSHIDGAIDGNTDNSTVSRIDNAVSVIDAGVDLNVDRSSDVREVTDSSIDKSGGLANASGLVGGESSVSQDMTVSSIKGNANDTNSFGKVDVCTESTKGDLDNNHRESNNNAIESKFDNSVNQSNINEQNKHDVPPTIDASVNQSQVTSNALAGTSFENRSQKNVLSEPLPETATCTNNNTHSCLSDDSRDVSILNKSIIESTRFKEIIDNLPAIDSDVNANE